MIPALRVSQSCPRTSAKSASGSTCDLGWCAGAIWALCTRPPAVGAPALLLGGLCPPARQSTENVFHGDHIGPGSRAVVPQQCCRGLDSEPPRGARQGRCTHEALPPVPSPTRSTDSKPIKTASVLPSMKLNGAHSPSSAPFISKESRAHNALYSLVLCHQTITALSLACPVEMPPPLWCSCQAAVLGCAGSIAPL